jgi:AcrR family transcriptional regulator
MTTPRRSFRRAGEEERRSDLIAATQECIIEGGIGAATIRKVADIAGVTPGLVRYYFPDKVSLLSATYLVTMSTMTQQATPILNDSELSACAKFRLFIEASLKPPVMQPRNYQLWASFTSLINSIPEITVMHRKAYLEYRNSCEVLIREVFIETGRELDDRKIKGLAIAVNALIDGLWIEGCMAVELFDDDELIELGVSSVQQILGLENL